jgi:hypothetical protein
MRSTSLTTEKYKLFREIVNNLLHFINESSNIVFGIVRNMSQNSVKKSNCPNLQHKRIPHWMIAQAVGCSISMVKAVRNGQRSNETDLGQRIEVAEALMSDKLINEVKKLVQIKLP